MSDNREKVAAEFREELRHAYDPDAKVMSADRELRYCLELQRARIRGRNLMYTDEMVHRGQFPGGLNNVRSWKDGNYETSWTVDFIEHNRLIMRGGMKTFKKREKQSIYETVVDVCDGKDVSGDTYCCPNCGSVSTVKELQEGCAYCGTSFRMSELYPKVANYFFVYDITGKADNLFKTVIKYGLFMLPFTLAIILLQFAADGGMSSLTALLHPSKLIPLVIGLVVTLPVAGFMGFMLSVFYDLFRAMITGIPTLISSAGSRTRFASKMSRISPEYTFEHYIARIVSLFKIAVFSDDRMELPFYEGKDNKELFDNVIDIAFSGTMALRQIKEKDNRVLVTGDIYTVTTRDLGNRIKSKDEIYRVTASRRTDIPLTTNFSITSIQCRSCGRSYNTFKTRSCPFCGSKSEPDSFDWIICDVQKIR